MNSSSQILFNNINHGYGAVLLKKNSLWLLPFYMAVASHCYYEQVRGTNELLEYFYSFSAAVLNNIESEHELFVQEFSCKESDYGDSDDEDIEQLYSWQVK